MTDRRWLRIGAGIIDLAAPDAGEVAAEQRLEHQHERVALTAEKLLLHQIAPMRISFRNGIAIAAKTFIHEAASRAAVEIEKSDVCQFSG